MRPAFSTPRQAAAFALLLLVILLAPILIGKSVLASREEMYRSANGSDYYFSRLHDRIFQEQGDIDIAFLSSSRLQCAINPEYVQAGLSQRLERHAVVEMLTWEWNGFDALYFICQDVLQHRKVKMLVFCDLIPESGNIAHHQASSWFRYSDNASALAGLPLISQLSFYANAIIGMPRNLVNLVRHNAPSALPEKQGTPWNYAPVEPPPPTSASPADVVIYSAASKGTAASKGSFQFSTTPIAAMQEDFIRKIAILARDHHTQLVYLHVSTPQEKHETFVKEKTYWPDAFGTDVPMLGIPPSLLFAHLSDAEVAKLYLDSVHFNTNGQIYFTSLVTPALLRVYMEKVGK